MKQRGVALITALLVVAIATIAATALLSSSEIALMRTASLRDTEQAWWYADGIESWVRGILEADAKDPVHGPYDGLDEMWAIPVTSLPVDEGTACGRVVDQQGLFNLNNLLVPPGTWDYGAQFQRLVSLVLPSGVQAPQGLLESIRDWIDTDDTPLPGGAEDLTYLGLTPPYRTANRPLQHISELLAVQGMTPELYRAIAPYVTALPLAPSAPAGPQAPPVLVATPINVNTAPEPVLNSLVLPGGSATALQSFLTNRASAPVKADGEARQLFTGNATPVTVHTQFFTLQGDIFVGTSHLALYSLIFRPKSGTSTVLGRSTVPELPGSPPCATSSSSSSATPPTASAPTP
ncbi:MAG TPA: type II secretion system minor pseudopilin GspK [Candidatus Binatia bacterium]|nr:type II secretion system minor pseudopilin GspK [Candidatus Binatia bacterium]